MSRGLLTRRLVSDDEAVPMKRQHKKPCADCPFGRTALKGWLGNYTAEGWIRMAHGEDYINCHCTTNQSCAGAAIYRSNVSKSCRDKTLLKLPGDTKLVFASAREFLDHHK